MVLPTVAVLLLAAPRLPPLVAVAPGAVPPPEVFRYLARFPRGRARALAASRLMVGTPYHDGPLGEGAGRDPQPRIRFDAVDCQTFVEEALALGEADGPVDMLAVLDDVRYAAAPSYDGRDHFVMSQWVPRNEAKGYVRDATAAVAGPIARLERKTVTAASWARRRRRPGDVDLPPADAPIGRFALPVVPLDRVLEVAPRIPDGTIALVVRADRAALPERVSHLGLIVHHAGVAYLRHASSVYRRVADEPLDHFVARNARYDGWPVSGLSLLSIRDASARVAALARAAPPTADARPGAAGK